MALIVQKYGGTSVGSPERIRAVAQRVASHARQGSSLAIVVSAMGQTTDELIELASKVSANPPHREMDMLLTTGERISMALLSMALSDLGVQAVSFTGSQSGIITDDSHRRARIKRILGDRIREALAQGKVAIVAGFQGVSEKKEITTLGRGGSDTTAVALASALKAERCEIYTDVDGVYSADPRVVPGAKLWESISHDAMVELANRGAGVLHPRSVELAKQTGMALWVLNSLKPVGQEGGTRVVASSQAGLEDVSVRGVTSDPEKFLLTVELARATVIPALWDRASRSHLMVVAPTFAGTQVQFFSDREGLGEWKKHLDELSRDGFIKNYKLDDGWIPLSVVGERFSQDGMALHRVFDALGRAHVPVCQGSASSLAITVGIPVTHSKEGVQALHDEFFAKGAT